MKPEIKKTEQTFDVDGATYYLDLCNDDTYMISRDEFTLKSRISKNEAIERFKGLSEACNSEIEIHN